MATARTAIGIILVLFGWLAHAQTQAPGPVPAGDDLLRMEGFDAGSGIHYLKFILILRNADTPKDAAPATLPRFTMECREHGGKRSLEWLVRFTGSSDFSFQPPQVATGSEMFPTPYPNLQLKMRFEGYKRSQEFRRSWEVLPTGELHYRNPGISSPNLDDPRSFLPWLRALPALRIAYGKPIQGEPAELVFPAKALLGLVEKADLCRP